MWAKVVKSGKSGQKVAKDGKCGQKVQKWLEVVKCGQK